MRYRKLRIAISAVCEIICLLLIALWVRSYWWLDVILRVSSNSGAELRLNSGTVYIFYESPPSLPPPPRRDPIWEFTTFPASPVLHLALAAESSIRFPYWCAVLLTGLFATAPWIRWRFSLRTLLIGMTLVAIVIGLVSTLYQWRQ